MRLDVVRECGQLGVVRGEYDGGGAAFTEIEGGAGQARQVSRVPTGCGT
ncbi:hypothetical protein ACQEVY_14835 [Streptomyces sp. CA-288835]